MKRSGINLILLVLVTILAAAVWLTPTDDHPRTLTPLTPLSPGKISSIRRTNRHGPPLRIERQHESWRMTEPYALAADAERVNRLLNIVSAPTLEGFPVPENRLSEFGLDAPLARLELNGMELVFGGTDPINHHRYVRFGGKLYLIKDIYAHHLMAPAEAFISPRLLTDEDKIIALRTPDWQLFRGPGGDWQLTPPAPGLSKDQLAGKIDSWRHGQAVKVEVVQTEETSRFVEIQLEGDQQPLRFAILDGPEGLLLVRQEPVLGYRLPVGSDLLTVPGEAKH